MSASPEDRIIAWFHRREKIDGPGEFYRYIKVNQALRIPNMMNIVLEMREQGRLIVEERRKEGSSGRAALFLKLAAAERISEPVIYTPEKLDLSKKAMEYDRQIEEFEVTIRRMKRHIQWLKMERLKIEREMRKAE